MTHFNVRLLSSTALLCSLLAACETQPMPQPATPIQATDIDFASSPTTPGPITFPGRKSGLAWVWNDRPSELLGTAYTPNAAFQFNDTDHVSVQDSNRIVRQGVGAYQVKFAGVNLTAGVAHATAYGGNHTCKVRNWSNDGDSGVLNVDCYSAAGTPTDGLFTASLYQVSSTSATSRGEAYLWADTAVGAPGTCYSPSAAYQYNARLGVNQVCFGATGEYTVNLPAMDLRGSDVSKNGHIQVTAYGAGSARCKVRSCFAAGTAIQAQIGCASGTVPTPAQFTLSFMRDPGRENFTGSGLVAHYLWADGSSSTPSIYYQSNQSGGPRTSTDAERATFLRAGLGTYVVSVPNVDFTPSTAQLTAYGQETGYCTLGGWSSTGNHMTRLFVSCFDGAGQPTDSAFNLLFETGMHIPG